MNLGVSDPKAKNVFRDPKIACDMLNGGLCHGIPYFRWENMERLPETSEIVYKDGEGREKSTEQTPDVVFCYHDEDSDIVVTFQNQKEMSLLMPVREGLSAFLLYYRQVKERRSDSRREKRLKKGAEYLSGIRESDRFSPVISVVFYYGEKEWSGAKELHEMLDFPAGIPGLKCFCPNYKINLIHSGNVNPNDFQTSLRQVFELLPHVKSKKEMMAYIKNNPGHFQNLDEEGCDMLETFLGFHILNDDTRKKYRTQKGGYNVCTALKELERDSERRGKKQGIAIGEKRGRKQASDAMLMLVNSMIKNGEAEKVELIQSDLKLRRKMLEKYQISL